MRYVLSILAALALCSQLQAADSENFEAVYVATHGAWVTNKLIDKFDESEVARFAFNSVGDDGSVRYVCQDSKLGFVAYADNMFIKTLGNMWELDKPIKVAIKVDDGEIIKTVGEYPNTIVSDPAMVTKVRDEFRSGNLGRLKTVHNDERHTFIFNLKGFTTASKWVEENCH